MTPTEIRDTYDTLSDAEAFEAFDVACVDMETLGRTLGPEVVKDYATWIYFHVK